MNLNLLISKYVDGDLTVEEDQLLRCLLSEDSAAKEAFDTATALHLTMLEDDDTIAIPKDLLLETEAKITMKFATDEAIIKALKRENRIKKLKQDVSKFSSAVVALLFIITVPFGDIFLQNHTIAAFNSEQSVSSSNVISSDVSHYISSKIKRSQSVHRNSKQEQSMIHSSLIADYTDNATVGADKNTQGGNPLSSNDGILSLQTAELGSKTAQYPSKTVANPFTQLSVGISQMKVGFSQSNYRSEEMVAVEQTTQDNETEIQVNTFLSNKVANNRDNSVSTTAISQSIAYSIDENSKIGLEIGYNGYSYRSGGTVLVPRGTSSVFTKSGILSLDGPENGHSGEVLNPTAERASQSQVEGFEEKKVEYSIDKTMYWGAAFYEYMIFHKGNISVNGRVGAGGSNDGAMAFSRAFARYDVVKGVALTIGAEASAFMVNMQTLPNDKGNINSGISLVYGMQIKF